MATMTPPPINTHLPVEFDDAMTFSSARRLAGLFDETYKRAGQRLGLFPAGTQKNLRSPRRREPERPRGDLRPVLDHRDVDLAATGGRREPDDELDRLVGGHVHPEVRPRARLGGRSQG